MIKGNSSNLDGNWDIPAIADMLRRLSAFARVISIDRHHGLVPLAEHRGLEIDTAGDGFYAVFDGPARAIRCARSIIGSVGTSASRFARVCTRANAR